MVTNLKEGSKTKCEQYWPESYMEPTTFGPFIVTLVDEQVLPDFVIRSLNVKVKMILREYYIILLLILDRGWIQCYS